MNRRGCTAALALVVGASTAAAARPVAAQSTYRLANGVSSVLQTTTGFVQGDFAEARIGATALHGFGSWGVTGYGTVSVRTEEWDMFSGMDWIPGLEVGVRLWAALLDDGTRQTVVWVGPGYRSVERKIAAFVDDTSTLMRTAERTQQDFSAGAGLHQRLGRTLLFGVAGSVRRERGSPGVSRPTEMCVPTQAPGGLYSVPICNDRYLDPLEDRWAGQVRADLLVGVKRLSSIGIHPHVALLAAGSLDFVNDQAAVLNVGGGPAIVAAQYPGQVVVALLVEYQDVLEANDGLPEEFVTRLGLDPSRFIADFSERFGLRVTVSIPFPILVQ